MWGIQMMKVWVQRTLKRSRSLNLNHRHAVVVVATQEEVSGDALGTTGMMVLVDAAGSL